MDEVLWPDLVGRENVLLLVDSWTSNKDDDLYKSTVPKNVKFIKRLIPAKCTGIVQPADVYFFRPYKNFVRFLTDTLLIAKDNVNIWHRDYFLRIQSFAHYQFSAKRFENLIRFAFFKCGYIVNHPGPFDTPIAKEFKVMNIQKQTANKLRLSDVHIVKKYSALIIH